MEDRQLVYIEWHDAFCNTGWLSREDVENAIGNGEEIVRQVGWIYKETKREIILVSRYTPKKAYTGENFGLVQKIPKTWIRKRINLNQKGFYE